MAWLSTLLNEILRGLDAGVRGGVCGGSRKRKRNRRRAKSHGSTRVPISGNPRKKALARSHTYKESLHLAEGSPQLSEHVGLADWEVAAVKLASAGPHSSQ